MSFFRPQQLTAEKVAALSEQELNPALTGESKLAERMATTVGMVLSGASAEQQQAQDFGARSMAAAA